MDGLATQQKDKTIESIEEESTGDDKITDILNINIKYI